MPLLTIVMVLIIVGVLLWLVSMIPMDATIHLVIRVLVIIVTCIWLLEALGVMGAVKAVHV